MSRMVTPGSSQATSDGQCAAYCLVDPNDCFLYHFDEVAAVCYVGMMETTTGQYEGQAGNKIIKFHKGWIPYFRAQI